MELLHSNLLVVTWPEVDLLRLQKELVILRVHWSSKHLSSSTWHMLESIAVEAVAHMVRCGLRSNRVIHVGRLGVRVAHLELGSCHSLRKVLATLRSRRQHLPIHKVGLNQILSIELLRHGRTAHICELEITTVEIMLRYVADRAARRHMV